MTSNEPRVRGVAADGMVVLEFSAGGELTVTLDPRVRRLDTDELATALEDAFRDARGNADALYADDDAERARRRAERSEALAHVRERLQASSERASELRRRSHGQR